MIYKDEGSGVWMDDSQKGWDISVSRRIAEMLMKSMGGDSSQDWRTRDKIISAISDYVGMCMDLAHEQGIAIASTSPASSTQVGGSHYQLPIQPWDYIAANKLGFFDGNVVKYVTRWPEKGGVQDLEKARHYLDKLIEIEKNPQSG